MFSGAGRLFPESITGALEGLFKGGASSISSALSAVQSLSLDKWVQIGALSNYSLLSLVSAHQVYRGLKDDAPVNESAVRAVMQHRESAVAGYRKATEEFNCGSYGAAMIRMESALSEFTNVEKKKYSMIESNMDYALQAEMLQFYGIVLFHHSQTHDFITRALENLQHASRLDPSLILTHNMTAFMTFYYLDDKECARTHLLNSLKLNGQQFFARYYLARIDHKESTMRAVIEELMQLCDAVTDQSSEWRNLQTTTMGFMIPFIFSDFLSYCSRHMKDARALSQLVNVCQTAMTKQPSDILKLCSITILEARITALHRLSKLKAHATIFEIYDEEFLKSNFYYNKQESESYFFQVSPQQLYRSVMGRLSEYTDNQANLEFLSEGHYFEPMSIIIMDWVAHGWLSNDDNESIRAICALSKRAKHLKGEALQVAQNEILIACQDSKVMWHFISRYLNFNWENICKSSSSVPEYSILYLLCSHVGIKLNFHNSGREEANQLTHDADDRQQETLHVLCDINNNQFNFLEKITAPSMIYSRLAIRDCWYLLQLDDQNSTAREMLLRKGAINLPGLQAVEKNKGVVSGYRIKANVIEPNAEYVDIASITVKPKPSRVSLFTVVSGGVLLLTAATAAVALSRK